jgi:hypothetical protein
MNAHFSTPDPHHRLGDSATRLRALFLKALAALQKPSIVDYAGLLRLARTFKNSTLKRVQLPFLGSSLGGSL